MGMSKRNSRQGKALRRAERERRRSVTSGQVPESVEAQAVRAVPRPFSARPRNPGERIEVRSDAGGDLTTAEPGEADLDASADPGDFGNLDPGDTDLQAALTVLAVLEDDIGDAAEVTDDLVDGADGP